MYGYLYASNIFHPDEHGYRINVCPNNWHVPTVEEWESLVKYLGGPDSAGIKLQAKYSIDSVSNTLKIERDSIYNSSGFTAFMSGYKENIIGNQAPNFHHKDKKACFFAFDNSNEIEDLLYNEIHMYCIDKDSSYVQYYSDSYDGINVRCIED